MTNIMLCTTSQDSQLPSEFTGDQTTLSPFQSAFLGKMRLCDDAVVVTNVEHYFTALDQIEELECRREAYFLLESLDRGSAASVLLACHSLCPESIVLISYLHYPMENKEDCEQMFKEAKANAKEGLIVHMSCHNGHVQTHPVQLSPSKHITYHSEEAYPKNDFYCFEVNIFLEAIKEYFPELYETSKQAYKNAKHNEVTSRILIEDMQMIPKLHFHELLQSMDTLDQKISSWPMKQTIAKSLES